jgi:hypothetical protein
MPVRSWPEIDAPSSVSWSASSPLSRPTCGALVSRRSGVVVGERQPGGDQVVAGALRQLALQAHEAVHAGGGEVARDLRVALAARGLVRGEQAAHAVAGLSGEGRERVGHELVATGVGRGQLLELGEPGPGLGQQGAAAVGVVGGEAYLRGLDPALDAVEGLAGQGGLGRDGHGGRRAHEGDAAEKGADAALAGARRGGHRQS